MEGVRVSSKRHRGRSTNRKQDNSINGEQRVQLPPLNIAGSQSKQNDVNQQFTNVNIGHMSASTKYSKYSSRVMKGRPGAQYSIFKNKMKKVIVSVDQRKKFNHTMGPTALGIQAIIIGEESKRHPDDKLELNYQNNRPMITGVDPELNQSQISKHLKLEPLHIERHSQYKENERKQSEESMDEIDVENMINVAKSTKSILYGSPRSRDGESIAEKSNRSDIPNRYDNQTTQNLCDLMNQANTSGKIFIPITKVKQDDAEYGRKIYKEELNPPMNHEGTTVFSKQGFIMVGDGRGQPSDYISHDNFVLDGINKQIFSNLPIFRKFQMLKTFKQWKYSAQYNKYLKTRELLCKNLIASKPQFSEGYVMINEAINDIKDLKFVEIKRSAIFARKQVSLIEKTEKTDILKSQADLSKILYRIKNVLKQLKDTIQKDDTKLDDERRK